MKSNTTIFFHGSCFRLYLKIHCQIQGHQDFLLCLTFRSLVIFCERHSQCLGALIGMWMSSCFSTLFEKSSLSPLNCFCSFVKDQILFIWVYFPLNVLVVHFYVLNLCFVWILNLVNGMSNEFSYIVIRWVNSYPNRTEINLKRCRFLY